MSLVFTIEDMTICTLKGKKSGKPFGYQRPPFELARKDYFTGLTLKGILVEKYLFSWGGLRIEVK
jgi:hypothetical protein